MYFSLGCFFDFCDVLGYKMEVVKESQMYEDQFACSWHHARYYCLGWQ